METNTKTPTATLIAHTGCHKIDRAGLAAVPTPARTSSHVPVPHALLIDTVESALTKRGIHITKGQFAVSEDGMKLFSTLTLGAAADDYAFALGIRAANDRSMSLQMCAGSNVFVCDNMAFSGEMITMKRKHTSRLDLGLEVAQGITAAQQQFANLRLDIDRLKGHSLENKDVVVKGILFDAVEKGIIPQRLMVEIWKEYNTPSHQEFAARNLWCLHNAFTEKFKTLKPNIAMEASIGLGSMFKMGQLKAAA